MEKLVIYFCVYCLFTFTIAEIGLACTVGLVRTVRRVTPILESVRRSRKRLCENFNSSDQSDQFLVTLAVSRRNSG